LTALVRNTIRTYAPDGQYWLVMEEHKRPRNPRGALAELAWGLIKQAVVFQIVDPDLKAILR